MVNIKTGIRQRINIHRINNLIMRTSHILNILTNLRPRKRTACSIHHSRPCLLQLILCWILRIKLTACRNKNRILIKHIQQIRSNIIRSRTNPLCKLHTLRWTQLRIQTNQTICKRSQRILITITKSNTLHQLLQRNRRLPLQRPRCRLPRLHNSNRIHNHKVVLILLRRRRNLLQIILRNRPCTASLHLLKVPAAPNIPHKKQTLNRLHISTRRNHIHRHRNTRIITGPEIRKRLLRICRRIRNLLTELITLPELLTDNLNNIISMTIRLRKHQSLWKLLSVRE